MKVRKFKSKQILLLHLLKFKVYEQTILKKFSHLKHCLVETLFNFKKSLKIIFNYHQKNKVIMFIGLPKNLEFKINKFTIHSAFSRFSKLEGNSMTKTPNLIVLFDHINIDLIIKKSYSFKIPLICINHNLINKNFYYRNIYKVFINQNRKVFQILNNFFFVGLSFLFK